MSLLCLLVHCKKTYVRLFVIMDYIVGNNVIGWNCKWEEFLCVLKGGGRKWVVGTIYGLVRFPVKANESMLNLLFSSLL